MFDFEESACNETSNATTQQLWSILHRLMHFLFIGLMQLYDLLVTEKDNTFINTGNIFSTLDSQVRAPFELCRSEIKQMEATRDSYYDEIDRIEADQMRSLPAVNTSDKLSKAGRWISDQGTETKLRAQALLMEQKIKRRKQAFGVDVMAIMSVTPESAKVGLKSQVSARMSKFSEKEQQIQLCIREAERDCASIAREISSKETYILSLGERVK